MESVTLHGWLRLLVHGLHLLQRLAVRPAGRGLHRAGTHTVQADNGDRYVVCDGHALTARTQITDGQVLLPGLPA